MLGLESAQLPEGSLETTSGPPETNPDGGLGSPWDWTAQQAGSTADNSQQPSAQTPVLLAAAVDLEEATVDAGGDGSAVWCFGTRRRDRRSAKQARADAQAAVAEAAEAAEAEGGQEAEATLGDTAGAQEVASISSDPSEAAAAKQQQQAEAQTQQAQQQQAMASTSTTPPLSALSGDPAGGQPGGAARWGLGRRGGGQRFWQQQQQQPVLVVQEAAPGVTSVTLTIQQGAARGLAAGAAALVVAVAALLAVRARLRSERARRRTAEQEERSRNAGSLAAQRSRFRSALSYSLDEDLEQEKQQRSAEQQQATARRAAVAAAAAAEGSQVLESWSSLLEQQEQERQRGGPNGAMQQQEAAASAGAASAGAASVGAVSAARGTWEGEAPPEGYWDDDDYGSTTPGDAADDDRVNPDRLDEVTRMMWRRFVQDSKLVQSRSWWDAGEMADDSTPHEGPGIDFDWNK